MKIGCQALKIEQTHIFNKIISRVGPTNARTNNDRNVIISNLKRKMKKRRAFEGLYIQSTEIYSLTDF